MLAQEGLFVLRADLEIVDSLHVRIVRMHAGVGERPVLGNGRSLQVRRTQVSKGVAAGIIIISVSSEEGAQVEDRIVTNDVGVGGRDIVRIDFGMLIGVAHDDEGWVGAGASARLGAAVFDVEVVKGIGCLEPGTAVVQVPMDRIGRGKAVVDAIKNVFLVTLVVEDGELRGIEKTAGIETVGLNEVAPALAAIGDVEAAICGPERTIGSEDIAGGLGNALT